MFTDNDNLQGKSLPVIKKLMSEYKLLFSGRIELAVNAAAQFGISEQMQNAIDDAQSKADIDFYAPNNDPNIPFYNLMKIKAVSEAAEAVVASTCWKALKFLESRDSK